MKMVQKIHFSIGIEALVFLLIQSVTGLTLYFSKNDPCKRYAERLGPCQYEGVSQDEAESVQGKGPEMEGGGQSGEGQRPGGMPGEDSTVKNIHD
ncbi:hypothetical protein MHI18_11095 [Peribacillus sp. FSL H8-0477]|uniref:hypothetical protein n=1 Tax=Peribacillus sp. FSL H8-0477 TaxID=2921388 RepID=UPI0030FA7441